MRRSGYSEIWFLSYLPTPPLSKLTLKVVFLFLHLVRFVSNPSNHGNVLYQVTVYLHATAHLRKILCYTCLSGPSVT